MVHRDNMVVFGLTSGCRRAAKTRNYLLAGLLYWSAGAASCSGVLACCSVGRDRSWARWQLHPGLSIIETERCMGRCLGPSAHAAAQIPVALFRGRKRASSVSAIRRRHA